MSSLLTLLAKSLRLQPAELSSVALAAFLHFLLLATYSLLRPVRDALGVQAGVRDLPWLFTATLIANIVALPVIGWLFTRYRRATALPWVYRFFAANLAALAAIYGWAPPAWNMAVALAFFVWLSFYVVAVISLFWAFCADVYPEEQARRAFGPIAMGGSAGAIAGPALSSLGARHGEVWQLLAIGCALLLVAGWCVSSMAKQRIGDEVATHMPAGDTWRAIGQAITRVFTDRRIRGVAIYVSLSSLAGTLLYFLQTQALADLAHTKARIAWLADVDLITNVLALIFQGWLCSRLIARWGIGWTLATVPAVCALTWTSVAAWPTLQTLAIAQIAQRSLTHGLLRPARESLFCAADRQAKYQSKAAIDLVVFRGSDALYAWLLNVVGQALSAVALPLAAVAWLGIPLGCAWGWLGRRLEKTATWDPPRAS